MTVNPKFFICLNRSRGCGNCYLRRSSSPYKNPSLQVCLLRQPIPKHRIDLSLSNRRLSTVRSRSVCMSRTTLTVLFTEFHDEIEIMKSLARPRKIVITGSDGQVYNFLGKPKDDLRKDARIMDFNGIINKQLKSKSETRRRQLCRLFHAFRKSRSLTQL